MLPTMQDESYLRTKQQAAKYLNVSQGSIERLMRAGLPYVKLRGLVRFRPEDLAAYIEARLVERIPEGRKVPQSAANTKASEA
jgi:excisionase family DNA binding protein